jgi:type 1 fimbria pilin
MGPECGSYGLAQKQFMYQGTGAPKVIGFDGMTPIFEIKSNETKVGVAIEVAKAGTGSYKYVASNTTTQYIEYEAGVDRPAIDIRLTEYVKIPAGAQPGVLVAGALYNKNIFYSSWDEIVTKGDKKTEVPLQVTLSSIVLQQPTCTISPSEKTKTVNMGSIDPSQFSGVGTKSNEVPFTFVLGNCNEVTTGMHMTFEADMPGTDASVFPTDRPELGLGLISLDSHGASGTGEPIVPNSQIDFDAASGGSYRFKAFLEQLDPGSISPGGVISRVRVLVNYD